MGIVWERVKFCHLGTGSSNWSLTFYQTTQFYPCPILKAFAEDNFNVAQMVQFSGIFSFLHNVFKVFLFQGRENSWLFGKLLNNELTNLKYSNDKIWNLIFGTYKNGCLSIEVVNVYKRQLIHWLIACMVFNAVFNSISVISWRPVHLSMLFWSSFNQYSTHYSFQATGCFPT